MQDIRGGGGLETLILLFLENYTVYMYEERHRKTDRPKNRQTNGQSGIDS